MCEPTTIALVAIAAVGAIAGKMESDKMQAANEKSAMDSYNAQMEQLQLQRQQINQQSTEKMSDVARAEQAKMAQLRVAAGEAGVAGVSVDRAGGEIQLDASEDIVSLQSNRANAMKQTTAEAAGIAAQTKRQMNSVRAPGWGQVALQIGGAAASAYAGSAKGSGGTSSGVGGANGSAYDGTWTSEGPFNHKTYTKQIWD